MSRFPWPGRGGGPGGRGPSLYVHRKINGKCVFFNNSTRPSVFKSFSPRTSQPQPRSNAEVVAVSSPNELGEERGLEPSSATPTYAPYRPRRAPHLSSAHSPPHSDQQWSAACAVSHSASAAPKRALFAREHALTTVPAGKRFPHCRWPPRHARHRDHWSVRDSTAPRSGCLRVPELGRRPLSATFPSCITTIRSQCRSSRGGARS